MKIKLKIIPGSSQDLIIGWLDDALKIKVKTSPQKGKANKTLIRLLSNALDIPQCNISILSGHTQANKIIEISGIDEKRLRAAIKG